MECHIIRVLLDGKMIYIQTVCEQWWKYEWNKLKIAISEAEYCQQFYRRHGLDVHHLIAVERGWTIEYLPVE